jgi:hypothetical protein
MGKKGNLLTERQVRQFMKLANLEPLAPGFIHGLDEKMKKGSDAEEDESLGMEDGPEDKKKQSEKDRRDDARADESHGRGRGEGAAGYGHPDPNDRAGARLREQLPPGEEEVDALDVDVEEDPLGPELPEDDLAPLEDEEGLDAAGGREVSVDDFLAALEIALEDVLGDEVEVDQEEDEEEEVELEGPGGEEELELGVADVEEEMPLQEMINTITKRVAKRIVREALRNKK